MFGVNTMKKHISLLSAKINPPDGFIFSVNPFPPRGSLGGVLESSAHKSAYSGPINMIPSAKWICYVLNIQCCMFNHANRTIGSEVTAGDRVVLSEGS